MKLVINQSNRVLLGAMCLLMSVKSFAATGEVGSGVDVAKVLGGLLVVVGAIGFTAWLMGKVTKMQARAPSVIQVIGGVNVGNRERVVVVEVAGQWLVVGVASGQVSQLAQLNKPHNSDVHLNQAPEGLQTQFENIMQNQLHKTHMPHNRHTDVRFRNLQANNAIMASTWLGQLQLKIQAWVKCFFNL